MEECVATDMNNNQKMTNEHAKRRTIMGEDAINTLTDECKYFHDLIVQVPSHDNNFINAIQVNKDLLHTMRTLKSMSLWMTLSNSLVWDG